ncbi:MAG: hypothetical protein IJH65_03355 [Methanobrevibacter sp.]|nr:hypothetical protein [Methanobrevibacter sp.]
MRKKGTITAIKFCLTILLRIKKLTGEISEESGTLIINNEDNKLEVRIPSQLASVGVVEDLFDYLLPAGMVYRVTEYGRSAPSNTVTDVYFTSTINSETVNDENITIYGSVYNESDPTDIKNTAGSTIHKNLVVDPESGSESSN